LHEQPESKKERKWTVRKNVEREVDVKQMEGGADLYSNICEGGFV